MSDLYEIEYYNTDDPEQDETDGLNTEQKLQLSERANVIYRQQLKFMQDHLSSLRSLLQEKENIIENLMLRFDQGTLSQDNNYKDEDTLPTIIKHQKIWKLSQTTTLQNFELRQSLYELRDENYYLRSELASQTGNKSEEILVDIKPNKRSSNGHYINELDALIERLDIDQDTDQRKRLKVQFYGEQIDELKKELEELEYSLDYTLNTQRDTEERTVECEREKDDVLDKYCPLLEQGVELEFIGEYKLNIERVRYQCICDDYDNLKKEYEKLMVVKINLNIIKKLFGCSIKALIPFQLNDNVLIKYETLFDGYFRWIFAFDIDCVMIPRDVIKLISWYYPIFWALTSV